MSGRTYGDKPISFQVEEGGEFYCIGSEVTAKFQFIKFLFFVVILSKFLTNYWDLIGISFRLGHIYDYAEVRFTRNILECTEERSPMKSEKS